MWKAEIGKWNLMECLKQFFIFKQKKYFIWFNLNMVLRFHKIQDESNINLNIFTLNHSISKQDLIRIDSSYTKNCVPLYFP